MEYNYTTSQAPDKGVQVGPEPILTPNATLAMTYTNIPGFGGNFIDSYVVVDGNLITAKSAAASIDFAYAIIEKLAGTSTLNKVKENIFYEKQGTFIFNQ